MKKVVIFDMDDYIEMCVLLHDTKINVRQCPDQYFRTEALNKLDRLREIMVKEEDDE